MYPQGAPASLALTAGVVAIKVLATAACRKRTGTDVKGLGLTGCLQQLLQLASQLAADKACSAEASVGPDELQWMSVCCANAGEQASAILPPHCIPSLDPFQQVLCCAS